jgi:hypothetical protein
VRGVLAPGQQPVPALFHDLAAGGRAAMIDLEVRRFFCGTRIAVCGPSPSRCPRWRCSISAGHRCWAACRRWGAPRPGSTWAARSPYERQARELNPPTRVRAERARGYPSRQPLGKTLFSPLFTGPDPTTLLVSCVAILDQAILLALWTVFDRPWQESLAEARSSAGIAGRATMVPSRGGFGMTNDPVLLQE